MKNIDRTIALIPSMDQKAQARLRQNAEDKLQNSSDSVDARNAEKIIGALSAFQKTRPASERFYVTGDLSWEKYQKGGSNTIRAFYEDRVVGYIFKRANHSNADKNVYSIEILGQTLPGTWHHISDARAAGEAAFTDRKKDTQG